MKSVGEKLRRERIERGIDLPTLSKLTRIRQSYLEAIESGTTGDVPSGFFYRSFVRQYATALGLDTEDIEADLDRVRQAEEPVLAAALQEAKFPVKAPDPIVTEGNRRYLGTGRTWVYVVLLTAVVIGCSFFYGWWRRIETASASRQQGITETAPAAAPSEPEKTAPPSSQPSAPAPARNPADPAATEQQRSAAQQRAATSPAAQSADTVSLAAVGGVPPAPKAPSVSPDDRVVVKLSATEATWVSVSSDGKPVFSGTLQPNQSITLGGKERAQVKLGNAGGVDISWNGKTLGTVGPHGHVRTLQMTPESYRVTAPDGSLL